MLLADLRLITPNEVLPEAWVRVEGDTVAATGVGRPPGRPDVHLDGHFVAPGFVDIHCHGGGGASYASADPEEVSAAASFHRRHGTTTALASLISAAPYELAAQVKVITQCVRDGVVAGCHLEGPYLSKGRCGAHDPTLLRDPELSELEQLLAIGDGTIAMVTIAPERRHALEAIAWLARRQVLPAMGHTDATFDQTLAAIGAGIRVATHLGNAIRPLHHREPGPLLALLNDHRVVCELIADGVHLHPGFLGFVARTAGLTRTALVSDAISAAGSCEGELQLGSITVSVKNGQARVKHNGALAGSTLTLDVAFRRAVSLYGFSMPAAVRATSTTPAALLGRNDLGSIRAGARADLVVLDDGLELRATMAGGAWLEVPLL